MFDNVKFEGTINLGAVVVAVIQLISAYTVLIRVRALIEEKNIKFNIFSKKKPALPSSDEQAKSQQKEQNEQGDNNNNNPS